MNLSRSCLVVFELTAGQLVYLKGVIGNPNRTDLVFNYCKIDATDSKICQAFTSTHLKRFIANEDYSMVPDPQSHCIWIDLIDTDITHHSSGENSFFMSQTRGLLSPKKAAPNSIMNTRELGGQITTTQAGYIVQSNHPVDFSKDYSSPVHRLYSNLKQQQE